MPSQTLRGEGQFITVGMDNADWNAKAILALRSSTLHGTIITLHQHLINLDKLDRLDIDILNPAQVGKKHVLQLPHAYTDVDPSFTLDKSEKFKLTPHDCYQNMEKQPKKVVGASQKTN